MQLYELWYKARPAKGKRTQDSDILYIRMAMLEAKTDNSSDESFLHTKSLKVEIDTIQL